MLSLVLTTLTVSAIPAKQGQWQIITLADGTEVRVMLKGDEHAHYYQDAEGNNYVFDETLKAYKTADMQKLKKQAAERRTKVNSRLGKRRNARRIGTIEDEFVGSKRGLIIMVEFTDKKFQEENNLELYKRVANEEDFTHSVGFKGSVHDYFKAQSRGVFDLTFDVVGPVQLKHNYSFYGRDSGGQGNDVHPDSMVVEACLGVADEVDFKDYDWNDDGEADQVFVLYAGPGQANGGSSSTIWPHMYWLSATNCSLIIDDVIVDTYACSCELQPVYSGYTATGWKIDGNGTICHEFSHCLGYPDMYDTDDGGNYGMGTWDLMDQGSYNDNGFCPAGYTGWERWVAGWLEPIELEGTMEVDNLKALSDGGESYIVYNKGHRDEYYILENRQKTGWDASLGGNGLLISRIDYNKNLWEQNIVNSTSSYYNDHEQCTVFHANNASSRRAKASGDAYPYASNNQLNNQLTNLSAPAATVYNKNIDGSYFMNVEITDITRNDDGTVSFKFTDGSDDPNAQKPQTTDLDKLPTLTYGDDDYQLPETTNEELPLTWTSSNTDVATISDNMIHILKAGNATITATQEGNDAYYPFTKTFSLTIAKAQLTITVKDTTMVEGDEVPEFTITYSGFQYGEDSTALTKLPIAKTTATSASKPGKYTIRVSGAKSDNYTMKYVSGKLIITEKPAPERVAQTLELAEQLTMTEGDEPYTLPETTNEGLSLVWTVADESIATVSDHLLTVIAAGSTTVTATQEGNDEYLPFELQFTLTVDPKPVIPTAIREIGIDLMDNKPIYNIGGQRIEGIPQKKGVYIVGGKKVVFS